MTKVLDTISKIIGIVAPVSTDAWEAWGLQLMVSVSLICQIFLLLFGGRRRYMSYTVLRYTILGAYLFSSYIVTIALGKLTVIQIGKHRPDYQAELKGLLAPLFLMQLGNPDNITAYSVEDNQLGVRQMLTLALSVIFVIWILIRCLDSVSPISLLYIPLFIAGVIRSAETVWALKSVHNESTSASAQQMRDTEREIQSFKEVKELPKDSVLKDQLFLQQIVKAYYRFKCLRPHLGNWIYSPDYISGSWLSLQPQFTFITIELELAFMFDVLYTKAPILYTKLGLTGRFITFFCLVATLCRFALIFKSAFLVDIYVAYTYALLMSVIILEGYQIVLMPFSEWAVVMIYNQQCNLQGEVKNTRSNWLVKKLLPFLSERCMKQRRWSNKMGQLDLLDRRLYNDWPQPLGSVSRVLGKNKELSLRWYLFHSRPKIPSDLKDLLRREVEELEKKRDQHPFDRRGEWTLEAHKLKDDVHDVLWRSIMVGFEKSIIVWHLATAICYSSAHEDSENCKGSKLLSDYMMYLLCLRPYMLSLTTTDITVGHAYTTLMPFLRYRDLEVEDALGALSTEDAVVEPIIDKETIITKKWHLLSDAKELAAALKNTPDKWKLISGIWVEMLCFAAYNCQIYHHAKMLRRGGELITHVWLLLAHNTDKFKAPPDPKRTSQNPSTSSAFM